MKRRLLVSMVLILMSATAACSGGGDDDSPGGDSDAGVDAGGADAGPTPGTVADFDECEDDADCANDASDCRLVGWTDSKQCLPACESNDQCGFSTYCYPANSSSTLGTPFAFMANHCWFSICGPGRQNGETGGACKLGKEAGIPVADQLDGFCAPIEDGLFGQCLEAGTVAAGGACDLDEPARDGQNCNPSTLCVGPQNATTGTCAQVCDPRKILTGESECTAEGESCLDQSEINTFADGSTSRSTLGFCTDVVACSTVGANTCPAGEGCSITNPLRPTGICDPTADGDLAPGATCGSGSGDAAECQAGSACLGTCRQLCDGPAPRPGMLGGACTATPDCKQRDNTCVEGVCVQACGGVQDSPCTEPSTCVEGRCTLPSEHVIDCNSAVNGTTCKPVGWDSGSDMQSGTDDDNFAADWGVCG